MTKARVVTFCTQANYGNLPSNGRGQGHINYNLFEFWEITDTIPETI